MTDQPKAIEDMTVEELREECKRANREAYDAQRKTESLLVDRARWERSAAAAIHRREWERVTTRDEFYARHEIEKMTQPLTGVLYRIEQLGERASTKQVAALKEAVRDARHLLSFDKDSRPDVKLLDAAEAEVARLREYVLAEGRALHEDVSVGDSPCRCRGCALIRGMDADAPSVLAAIAELATS